MATIYGVGLIMALLAGGAIGWLLTIGHFQRIASQHREYENELAEVREFYVAWAMARHIRPGNSMRETNSMVSRAS